jgi:hypothetical protein
MNDDCCARDAAHELNAACECVSMDDALLERALKEQGASLGLGELMAARPSLFSREALFADAGTLDAMAELVRAVERVVVLPSYQERALADAPALARIPSATRGAFLGFDFHLSASGPELIEINTNAGGGLLNVLLRKAQKACCEPVARALGMESDVPPDFFAMFQREWQLARGALPLKRVAIVDDAPEAQFLYPEFVLFKALCEARGVEAVICDARELNIAHDVLQHQGKPIDLVYNRLTDFALSDPEHQVLAEALARDLTVITPHPRAHTLYADKRRLTWLSSEATLRELGANEHDIRTLVQHVPPTFVVRPEDREHLWQGRKGLFFKPWAGYGSKATYRGDQITKSAFEDVLRSAYVAQALVPPSSRKLCAEGEPRELKADVRTFAYAGEMQLVCARLYQGQTTNFRTPGGGFAPVYRTAR